MAALSLDSLTLTDASPVELIRGAAAAGFDLVSLSTLLFPAYPRMEVTPGNVAECAAALADCGVACNTLEAFDLISQAALESYRPLLELGARLGARSTVAIHLVNPDSGEVAELLAAFTEMAGEFGMRVLLEPIAMARTATLAQGRDMIRASGADVGMVMDVWHLIRSGCGVEQLREIEPGLIRHVQLCDGPLQLPFEDWMAEVMGERLYPGDGEFPLAELIRELPRDIPWAIEAPSLRRAQAGLSAEEQACEAMAAMRRVMAGLD